MLTNNKQPEVKTKDGLQATRIALALQKSYENNETVNLENRKGETING